MAFRLSSTFSLTPMNSRLRSELAAGLVLWGLLSLAWLVYQPGLAGGFLFDDYSNLAPLGAYGPIHNWNTFVTYMLSGISSPTGRPIALLSFLLDARNWPTSPYPFKVTNVLIHLLNGALLAWLSLKLLRLRLDAASAAWAAVLAAGIWLLHPYLVGVTLYVVQRMAMLDALFVMAALLAYLHGRQRLQAGRARNGWLWLSLGFGGFYVLAVLSKGNGALLPLFVLLIEATVLAGQPFTAPRSWRPWRWIFLYLPLIVFSAYLLSLWPGILASDGNKYMRFTVWQRLLTEPRVLLDYLWHLLAPRAYTAGLATDNYPISTGPLHPWTTLPALTAVIGLIAFAWRARRRRPYLALAILFYFAAQSLESSFIPLEIYFEYRNYLPSIFLPLPLALWLVNSPHLRAWMRPALAAALLALLAGLTYQRATLWGHPFEQAKVWYLVNPGSARGATMLALQYEAHGQYPAAVAVLDRTLRRHPNDLMLTLNLGLAECGAGRLSPATLAHMQKVLRTTPWAGNVVYNALDQLIDDWHAGRCGGLHAADIETLIAKAMENSVIATDGGLRQGLFALRGKLALLQGHPRRALADFRAALSAWPEPGAALRLAAELGASGHPRLGLELLDYYRALKPVQPQGFNVRRLHALWLEHIGFYRQQMAHVRKILEQQVHAPKPSSAPSQQS